MSTYNEIKTAALSLTEKEQDKLLAELTASHTARKAGEKAEKATGWKKTAWKVAAAIATIAGIIIAGVSVSGCSTAVKQQQTETDGTVTVTERSFSLNGTEAATLARYFIPVVTTK